MSKGYKGRFWLQLFSLNVLVRMKLLKQAPHLEVNLLVQECLYKFTNVLKIVYKFFKATTLQILREKTEFPFLKELTFVF